MKSTAQTIFNILIVLVIAVLAAPSFGYHWQAPLAKSDATAAVAAYNTPVAVSTCPACDAAAAQVVPPTPALAEAKVVKDYCAFAGGRWFNKANDGVQSAGFFDRAKLMGPGLPLQPFFVQVNTTGTNQVSHGGTIITIPDQEEMLNDGGGSQLIGCEDANGVLHVYQADRTNDAFNKVSYVVWTVSGPIGYPHDTGEAGTWFGSPSGTPTIAYTEVTESSVDPDLAIHYQAVVALMGGPTPAYFDYGVIVKIW
jgi:hypothetical protein